MANIRQFTELVRDQNISLLRCLHGMLEYDSVNTRENFCDLMEAAFKDKKLDPRDMSNDLGYSISSVYRWIDGTSAPHRSAWPIVVDWIKSAIELKLADYNASRSVVQ